MLELIRSHNKQNSSFVRPQFIYWENKPINIATKLIFS